MTTTKLTRHELEQALAFIKLHGASTVFPQPFEYKAIELCWDDVLTLLTKIDLDSYQATAAYRMFTPKHTLSVRPVQILDPIDMLVYTALVLRVAASAEPNRFNKDTVFSYRYGRDSDGMAVFQNDWAGFREAASRLATRHEYIAQTDIVDYFPRIYLHRQNNAIAAFGFPDEARVLEKMLTTWSDGTSYGLPVGPLPSNFLAELLMHEVDDYLESQGIPFVRYVDDFVLLGQSVEEVTERLHLLGERLHVSQGLSINVSKTVAEQTEDFLSEIEHEQANDAWRIQNIVDGIFGGDPYEPVEYGELSDEEQAEVDALDVHGSLVAALGSPTLDTPKVNILLTMMASMKRDEPLELVLDNLLKLSPVAAAISRYLGSFSESSAEIRNKISKTVIRFVREASQARNHQVVWLLRPFTESESWNQLGDIRSMRRDHPNIFVRREFALAIGQSGDRSGLLDLRYSIDEASHWERRAIIYACRNLPHDEKRAFLKTMMPTGDPTRQNILEKCVVSLARKMP